MAKILLVYAFPGSGHEHAARALQDAASAGADFDMEAYHLGMDLPRFTLGMQSLKKHVLLRAPGVWKHVHGNRRYKHLARFVIRWFLRHGWLGLKRRLGERHYEAIVATHSLMIQLLGEARLLELLSVPVYGVMTDFRSQYYWSHAGIDGYFASTEESRMDLIRAGVRPERILVTGIPVRQPCASGTLLKRNQQTVLVAGGNAGLFPYEDIFNIVERLPEKEISWIFLLGTNKKMEEMLQARLSRTSARHIRLFSYQKDVITHMQTATAAITKAGGLFCSEALVSGLPLIVYRPFPGQEERNALYLRSGGAALRAPSAQDAVLAARRVAGDPVMRRTLSRAARSLARPHASRIIIRHLSNACH